VTADEAYLRYIRESLDLLDQRTARGRAAFLRDDVLQDAVLRRLETLADAANQLSDPLKNRHPDVRWPEIAGFRNRIAHGYLHVDFERVWDVIEIDLPGLREVIDLELGK
jgi:uncharacterized protein with HEPN domain